MWLVVGLGNPGRKYEKHRHNAGFMALRELARRAGVALSDDRQVDGLSARATLAGTDVLLLAPQTYMNLSGEAAGPTARYYKIPLERVIAIHDELDLPFGTVRLKQGGGTAGHNGLKSLASHLGGKDFLRVRIGIDRPAPDRDVVAHVLSDFSKPEAAELPQLLDRAADAVEAILRDGPATAMNTVNRRDPAE